VATFEASSQRRGVKLANILCRYAGRQKEQSFHAEGYHDLLYTVRFAQILRLTGCILPESGHTSDSSIRKTKTPDDKTSARNVGLTGLIGGDESAGVLRLDAYPLDPERLGVRYSTAVVWCLGITLVLELVKRWESQPHPSLTPATAKNAKDRPCRISLARISPSPKADTIELLTRLCSPAAEENHAPNTVPFPDPPHDSDNDYETELERQKLAALVTVAGRKQECSERRWSEFRARPLTSLCWKACAAQEVKREEEKGTRLGRSVIRDYWPSDWRLVLARCRN
jgi:hypothetical protein